MKKNVLNDIEKIKESRKLSKKVEKKIFARMVSNCAIGIAMLIFIYTFLINITYLTASIATYVYYTSTIVFLISALVIIEIAYKKDSGKWAITGIEILALSIFTLFIPYIFISTSRKFSYFIIAVIAIYYTVKIIRIYCNEKNKYLNSINDITNIIKKESRDELATQEKEKRKEELRKFIEKEQTKKKTTTRKTSSKKKTQTTNKKTSTKKSEVKKTEPAKKKPTAKKTVTKKKEPAKTTNSTAKKKTINKENK